MPRLYLYIHARKAGLRFDLISALVSGELPDWCGGLLTKLRIARMRRNWTNDVVSYDVVLQLSPRAALPSSREIHLL